MPDPRLKEAAEEIKAILTKYDVGAFIALVSKSHSEWVYRLPEWGCIKLAEKDGKQGVHIRSKLEDYASKEEQKAHIEVSCHCIYQLRDLGDKCSNDMQQVIHMIESHFQVEHTPYSEG